LAHTGDRPVSSLERSKLWSQLSVLARFLLALSFNNKLNGEENRQYGLALLLEFAVRVLVVQ